MNDSKDPHPNLQPTLFKYILNIFSFADQILFSVCDPIGYWIVDMQE